MLFNGVLLGIGGGIPWIMLGILSRRGKVGWGIRAGTGGRERRVDGGSIHGLSLMTTDRGLMVQLGLMTRWTIPITSCRHCPRKLVS